MLCQPRDYWSQILQDFPYTFLKQQQIIMRVGRCHRHNCFQQLQQMFINISIFKPLVSSGLVKYNPSYCLLPLGHPIGIAAGRTSLFLDPHCFSPAWLTFQVTVPGSSLGCLSDLLPLQLSGLCKGFRKIMPQNNYSIKTELCLERWLNSSAFYFKK